MFQTWAISDAAIAEAVFPLVRLQSAGVEQKLLGERRGSIATVMVEGVLSPYGLWTSYRDGPGTSVSRLMQTVDELRRDPKVAAVAFLVNSPGGSSQLIPEAGDAIAGLTKSKPTAAFVQGGWCCSGAIWLASQTGRIFATRGATVGSIGSYIVATDTSTLADRIGVKIHVIRSTPLKGLGVPGEPVTDALRGEMQRLVDGSHALFRDALATGRKMTPEQLDAVATGQVWRADEAVRLRLVDSIVPSLDGAFAAAGWSGLLQSEAKSGKYQTSHNPLMPVLH